MAGKLNGYSKLITITTLILLILGTAFGAFTWLSSRITYVQDRSDTAYASKDTAVALKESFSGLRTDVRSLHRDMASMRTEQKDALEKARTEQREDFRILSDKVDDIAKAK